MFQNYTLDCSVVIEDLDSIKFSRSRGYTLILLSWLLYDFLAQVMKKEQGICFDFELLILAENYLEKYLIKLNSIAHKLCQCQCFV